VSDDLSIPNSGYRGSRAGRYGTGRFRHSPHTRRLVLFAGGVGAVLVALIGASALMGRHSGDVPVVTADTRPVREKPVNPGGLKVDSAENDVFTANSDTANARLAAAPESPDASGFKAPAAQPAPAVAATAAPASTAEPDASGAPAPAIEAPAATAMQSPPPSAPVPAAKPAVVAMAPPLPKPAPAKPAPAAAESHSATSGHQLMVQLAAVSSEDAAHATWAQMAKKMPDLLNGRQPSYTRIERGGHTFWRIRTAGFGDIAQARAFCDHVRAKGAGCSVADF
jgi:hypothetical protein